MASANLDEKENFTRLSRLLVDKGTEALRNTLDNIRPPGNLAAVLNASKTSLSRLKFKVINAKQWDLLFPPSGNPPDPKRFDVTLLTVLLRNICRLPAPATGWNVMPPVADNSIQANITRIKVFRNEVHAHPSSADIDNTKFENLWQKISHALVGLNVPQKEIDYLKDCPLGPEEEIYVQTLKELVAKEEDSKNILDDIRQSSLQQQDDIETIKTSMQHLTQNHKEKQETGNNSADVQLLRKLAKHKFKSKISKTVKLFHHGTREWLLKEVENWFKNEDESRLLVITAGPGFGKSVFAAKVCKVFAEKGKLAACHFCDFSKMNLKDPMKMLQSLASHMCESLPGFKDELLDQLNRPHSVDSLSDAFQIYLQNPLDDLEVEPSLIVIDGLDESKTDDKSDIMKLIADHFPDLPKCVKVMVTSRPEISIDRLNHIRTIKINSNEMKNQADLLKYLKSCLPDLVNRDTENTSILQAIAKKCEGSFLYAFHIQQELRKQDDLDNITCEEIMSFFPAGISSVYQKYFHRLDEELEAIVKEKPSLLKLLELLVAVNKSLPLRFIARALDLDLDCCGTRKLINEVNEAVSCLLYVSNDVVTVFHKSVYDWLLADGFDDHEYTVKIIDGKRCLWKLCEQIFEEIKQRVVSGHKLKQTKELKHALEYGHEYLLDSNMKDSFSWLVDIVIVHVQTTVHPKNTQNLENVLEKFLQKDLAIKLDLRQRISWHYLEISNLNYFNQNFSYLESVLDRSPKDLFTEDEKEIATTLIAKARPCVKRISSQAKTVSLPVAKRFPLAISAVGASSDKKLAAVALEDGTVCVLELPGLDISWQYSTDYQGISCCTFAPDNSFILYGKLETALGVDKKKEVSFFGEKGGTFKSCAFSPSGNRLVTNDGSSTVKLWDVPRQRLLTNLCAEDIWFDEFDFCGFSSTGLFIFADHRNGTENTFFAWNSITFQRVDQRSLSVSKSNERGVRPKSERCNRCLWQRRKALICSKMIDIETIEQRRGIYNQVDCIFYLFSHFLYIIECAHFTTLAILDLFIETSLNAFDITPVDDHLWLYIGAEKLAVCISVPPKESHLFLPLPTRVLWCSFYPDGSRLATCTLDGYINLWNVNTCQIYQRFGDNIGTFDIASWWSDKHFFVCHIIDCIFSLSKYPVDEDCKIIISQRQPVEICPPTGFSSISGILDFSEGYLLVSSRMDPVKVLDVSGTEQMTHIDIFEGRYEPAMTTAVSVGGTFVLHARLFEQCFVWKKSERGLLVYELLFKCDLEFNVCDSVCFTDDSKFAVVCYSSKSSDRRYDVIDLNTRAVESHKIQDMTDPLGNMTGFLMKVFSTDTLVIGVSQPFIEIFDLKTWKRLGYFHHDLNVDNIKPSKLSPKGSVPAVPNMFGDIEFFQLRIPKHSSVLSKR